MTLDNILEEIKKAKKIVILTHENPDGDAVGSSLAMYMTLVKMGKEPDLIIPELPRVFRFLPNADKIKTEGSEEPYDLAISLDSATIKMLNGLEKGKRGEEHNMAKLKNEDVITIRQLYASGITQTGKRYSQRQLAKMYGVRQATIWGILHGVNWSHI